LNFRGENLMDRNQWFHPFANGRRILPPRVKLLDAIASAQTADDPYLGIRSEYVL
jgi:hypothetical protein